jgi:CO/xanthine dehydrogenase FAD-binding subunit
MDLATLSEVLRPARREELPARRSGDAWLGGGTWLFSEPQIGLKRLIDLDAFGWPALTRGKQGLTIAATCRIAALHGFEPVTEWPGTLLFRPCCEALQSSFKIWNTATVGGNLCLALPAGTLIALSVALEGRCVIWQPEEGERFVEAASFVTDTSRNVLRAGELLRAVLLPATALARKAVCRHVTATRYGRTTALVIGTRAADDGDVSITIAAATRRPLRIAFETMPEPDELRAAIAATAPPALYFDDAHATAERRRDFIFGLAQEVRSELAG